MEVLSSFNSLPVDGNMDVSVSESSRVKLYLVHDEEVKELTGPDVDKALGRKDNPKKGPPAWKAAFAVVCLPPTADGNDSERPLSLHVSRIERTEHPTSPRRQQAFRDQNVDSGIVYRWFSTNPSERVRALAQSAAQMNWKELKACNWNQELALSTLDQEMKVLVFQEVSYIEGLMKSKLTRQQLCAQLCSHISPRVSALGAILRDPKRTISFFKENWRDMFLLDIVLRLSKQEKLAFEEEVRAVKVFVAEHRGTFVAESVWTHRSTLNFGFGKPQFEEEEITAYKVAAVASRGQVVHDRNYNSLCKALPASKDSQWKNALSNLQKLIQDIASTAFIGAILVADLRIQFAHTRASTRDGPISEVAVSMRFPSGDVVESNTFDVQVRSTQANSKRDTRSKRKTTEPCSATDVESAEETPSAKSSSSSRASKKKRVAAASSCYFDDVTPTSGSSSGSSAMSAMSFSSSIIPEPLSAPLLHHSFENPPMPLDFDLPLPMPDFPFRGISGPFGAEEKVLLGDEEDLSGVFTPTHDNIIESPLSNGYNAESDSAMSDSPPILERSASTDMLLQGSEENHTLNCDNLGLRVSGRQVSNRFMIVACLNTTPQNLPLSDYSIAWSASAAEAGITACASSSNIPIDGQGISISELTLPSSYFPLLELHERGEHRHLWRVEVVVRHSSGVVCSERVVYETTLRFRRKSTAVRPPGSFPSQPPDPRPPGDRGDGDDDQGQDRKLFQMDQKQPRNGFNASGGNSLNNQSYQNYSTSSRHVKDEPQDYFRSQYQQNKNQRHTQDPPSFYAQLSQFFFGHSTRQLLLGAFSVLATVLIAFGVGVGETYIHTGSTSKVANFVRPQALSILQLPVPVESSPGHESFSVPGHDSFAANISSVPKIPESQFTDSATQQAIRQPWRSIQTISMYKSPVVHRMTSGLSVSGRYTTQVYTPLPAGSQSYGDAPFRTPPVAVLGQRHRMDHIFRTSRGTRIQQMWSTITLSVLSQFLFTAAAIALAVYQPLRLKALRKAQQSAAHASRQESRHHYESHSASQESAQVASQTTSQADRAEARQECSVSAESDLFPQVQRSDTPNCDEHRSEDSASIVSCQSWRAVVRSDLESNQTSAQCIEEPTVPMLSSRTQCQAEPLGMSPLPPLLQCVSEAAKQSTSPCQLDQTQSQSLQCSRFAPSSFDSCASSPLQTCASSPLQTRLRQEFSCERSFHLSLVPSVSSVVQRATELQSKTELQSNHLNQLNHRIQHQSRALKDSHREASRFDCNRNVPAQVSHVVLEKLQNTSDTNTSSSQLLEQESQKKDRVDSEEKRMKDPVSAQQALRVQHSLVQTNVHQKSGDTQGAQLHFDSSIAQSSSTSDHSCPSQDSANRISRFRLKHQLKISTDVPRNIPPKVVRGGKV